MSLNNPNPAFESQVSTDAAAAADQATAATAAAQEASTDKTSAAEQSTSTALAPAAGSALAAPRAGSRAELLAQSNVLENEVRNAMPVTWEDFTAINANQGQFQIKGGDSAKPIGSEIGLKLVSFQDQFVSGAKDTEADGEGLVKYSDDGVNLNDGSGMTIAEHKKYVEEQGEEHVMSHRLVLVGELTKAGEAAMDEIGNLVQVVLSESGRRNFQSHTKQTGYQIANGRLTADDALFLKLTATATGTGKKQYTLVKVTYGEGHGPNKVDTSAILG